MTMPRVALLGIILESNRFAPVAGAEDFRTCSWLEGDAILEEARTPNTGVAKEVAGFAVLSCETLNQRGNYSAPQ